MEFEASFSNGNVFMSVIGYHIPWRRRIDDLVLLTAPPSGEGGVRFIFSTSRGGGRDPHLMRCPIVPPFYIRPTIEAALSAMRVFHRSQVQGFSATIGEFLRATFLRVMRTMNYSILLEVRVNIHTREFAATMINPIPRPSAYDRPSRSGPYYGGDGTFGGRRGGPVIVSHRLEDDVLILDAVPRIPSLRSSFGYPAIFDHSNQRNIDDEQQMLEDAIVANQNEDIFPEMRGFGAIPASRSTIDSIPSTFYSVGATVDVECEKECCSICLEDLMIGDRVSNLPCKHLFHTLCILQWLENSNCCPLCRDPLPDDG